MSGKKKKAKHSSWRREAPPSRTRLSARINKHTGVARGQPQQNKLARCASSFIQTMASNHLPQYFVFVLCVLYALQLGALEPAFSFQSVGQQTVATDNCTTMSYPLRAYAVGDELLLPVPHSESSEVSATFAGSSNANAVQLRLGGSGLQITSLEINGHVVCAPCEDGKKYELGLGDANSLRVFASAINGTETRPPPIFPVLFKSALINGENLHYSRIETPLSITISGGWRADENTEMPSTFYGVDAPFHIRRIPLLAGYLSNWQWPTDSYSFISILPATLLYMASGIPYEYAYKLYEIALFFLPILIFALAAGKLKKWRGGTFLFASLIYLYLPSIGYTDGGGADLFIYGMTAHTLASYLSLFFFIFAYEVIFEGKHRRFLMAVAFFFLAFLSNQRIALPMCIMLGVFLFWAWRTGKLRGALLLAFACAASVLWLAAPFFLFSGIVDDYITFGGIDIHSYEQGAVSFFQIGYLALPFLFFAGVFSAYKSREAFLLCLCAAGVLSFLAATSPDLNRIFPFIDGVRLLPSFVLPAIFLSGWGTRFLWGKLCAAFGRLAVRLKTDRLTLGGAIAFAIMLPLSIVFLAFVQTTPQYYAEQAGSLPIAMEYSGLKSAYGTIGDGRALFLLRGEVSQYPIYEKYMGSLVIMDYSTPDELVQDMRNQRARYAILGGTLAMPNKLDPQLLWRQYIELRQDARFSEIATFGPTKAFELADWKEGGGTDAESGGKQESGAAPGQAAVETRPDAPQWQLLFALLCPIAVAICWQLNERN